MPPPTGTTGLRRRPAPRSWADRWCAQAPLSAARSQAAGAGGSVADDEPGGWHRGMEETMFRRGITSLVVAGSLLLGVAAPAVLADTFPAGNADLYAASSSWDSGESNIGIGATVGTQDGVAIHSLSVSSFLVQDITCR